MELTEKDLNEITAQVKESIREDSATIEQLPMVQNVSGGTRVEINAGRSANMDTLKRYIAPIGHNEGEVFSGAEGAKLQSDVSTLKTKVENNKALADTAKTTSEEAKVAANKAQAAADDAQSAADTAQETADEALAKAFKVVKFAGVSTPPPSWEVKTNPVGLTSDDESVMGVFYDPEHDRMYIPHQVTSSGGGVVTTGHEIYLYWSDAANFGKTVNGWTGSATVKPFEHTIYSNGRGLWVYNGSEMILFADLTDSTYHQAAFDAASVATFNALWLSMGYEYNQLGYRKDSSTPYLSYADARLALIADLKKDDRITDALITKWNVTADGVVDLGVVASSEVAFTQAAQKSVTENVRVRQIRWRTSDSNDDGGQGAGGTIFQERYGNWNVVQWMMFEGQNRICKVRTITTGGNYAVSEWQNMVIPQFLTYDLVSRMIRAVAPHSPGQAATAAPSTELMQLPLADQNHAGLMSNEDKVKLDNMGSGGSVGAMAYIGQEAHLGDYTTINAIKPDGETGGVAMMNSREAFAPVILEEGAHVGFKSDIGNFVKLPDGFKIIKIDGVGAPFDEMGSEDNMTDVFSAGSYQLGAPVGVYFSPTEKLLYIAGRGDEQYADADYPVYHYTHCFKWPETPNAICSFNRNDFGEADSNGFVKPFKDSLYLTADGLLYVSDGDTLHAADKKAYALALNAISKLNERIPESSSVGGYTTIGSDTTIGDNVNIPDGFNGADVKSTADTAQTTAGTAQTTANTAKTTANTAKTTADTAKATAETASTTANTAKTTAEAASTTATTAQTTANTAKTTADTAKATAETAKSTADTANTNATAAKTAATEAKTAATEAKTTATTAKATADTANTTATTAKTTADTAKATADAAQATADAFDQMIGDGVSIGDNVTIAADTELAATLTQFTAKGKSGATTTTIFTAGKGSSIGNNATIAPGVYVGGKEVRNGNWIVGLIPDGASPEHSHDPSTVFHLWDGDRLAGLAYVAPVGSSYLDRGPTFITREFFSPNDYNDERRVITFAWGDVFDSISPQWRNDIERKIILPEGFNGYAIVELLYAILTRLEIFSGSGVNPAEHLTEHQKNMFLRVLDHLW